MYAFYYGIHLGTPQPDPPNMVAMISPVLILPAGLAMATPLPQPPNLPAILVPTSVAMLSPQPEPPDKAILLWLRDAVAEYAKQIEEALAKLEKQEC